MIDDSNSENLRDRGCEIHPTFQSFVKPICKLFIVLERIFGVRHVSNPRTKRQNFYEVNTALMYGNNFLDFQFNSPFFISKNDGSFELFDFDTC